MTFNISNNVRVQLTDYGRLVAREGFYNFWSTISSTIGCRTPFHYIPPLEDEAGWSTWQLWRLMQIFGMHMGMGRELCFATEIELVIKE